jgi:hypothetical protein
MRTGSLFEGLTLNDFAERTAFLQSISKGLDLFWTKKGEDQKNHIKTVAIEFKNKKYTKNLDESTKEKLGIQAFETTFNELITKIETETMPPPLKTLVFSGENKRTEAQKALQALFSIDSTASNVIFTDISGERISQFTIHFSEEGTLPAQESLIKMSPLFKNIEPNEIQSIGYNEGKFMVTLHKENSFSMETVLTGVFISNIATIEFNAEGYSLASSGGSDEENMSLIFTVKGEKKHVTGVEDYDHRYNLVHFSREKAKKEIGIPGIDGTEKITYIHLSEYKINTDDEWEKTTEAKEAEIKTRKSGVYEALLGSHAGSLPPLKNMKIHLGKIDFFPLHKDNPDNIGDIDDSEGSRNKNKKIRCIRGSPRFTRREPSTFKKYENTFRKNRLFSFT